MAFFNSWTYSALSIPRKGTETYTLACHLGLFQIRSALSIPRKGTKTSFSQRTWFLNCLRVPHYLFPARGRKRGTYLLPTFYTTFRTIYSPQGDGNSTSDLNSSKYWIIIEVPHYLFPARARKQFCHYLFTCSNDLFRTIYSPQGDENL